MIILEKREILLESIRGKRVEAEPDPEMVDVLEVAYRKICSEESEDVIYADLV